MYRPNPSALRHGAACVLALCTALVITGCAGGDAARPPTAHASAPTASSTPTALSTPTPQLSVGEAATASGRSVDVYDRPDGSIKSTMSNPTSVGAPLTYLVVDSKPGWLKVDLPIRPNGSTGWIKTSAVSLSNLVYRLQVSTEANKLTLYKGSTVIDTFPAATGTGGTPTPHGSFYLVELLAPTNAGYGPYAFGLSGYSDVLSSFGGGPGQIGLHGTDDPSSIGHSASHGCIRLSNADITRLARLLPLGTPIVIE